MSSSPRCQRSSPQGRGDVDCLARLRDVAGERITLYYAPATRADQAAIDAPGRICLVYHGHQVNAKPELRRSGTLGNLATTRARTSSLEAVRFAPSPAFC